ncbi:hypothetical protein KHA80_13065 [Anaerobacillus sp. HL2]|nr:hypothetical protein KHA80_13065 [Anaerobacillus sp. HL2]
MDLFNLDGSALDASRTVQGQNGKYDIECHCDGEAIDAVIQEGTYTDSKVLFLLLKVQLTQL